MELITGILVFLMIIIIGMLFGRINMLVVLIFEGIVKNIKKLF